LTGARPAICLPTARTLNIREYTALFGLIGFSYGGDKQNTFGLPDLRGRTTIGKGQGTGLPINIAMGQSVGQQQLTLSTARTAARPHPRGNIFRYVFHHQSDHSWQQRQLAVTAALQVVPGTGNISGNNVTLGANQTGYLAGMNGATSADPVSFTSRTRRPRHPPMRDACRRGCRSPAPPPPLRSMSRCPRSAVAHGCDAAPASGCGVDSVAGDRHEHVHRRHRPVPQPPLSISSNPAIPLSH
jgi:microcystin-dependent protein